MFSSQAKQRGWKDQGAFNNYVDQILSNFDPLTPRVNKHGHFTYTIYSLSHDPRGLSTDPLPPFLVHIVIECPQAEAS